MTDHDSTDTTDHRDRGTPEQVASAYSANDPAADAATATGEAAAGTTGQDDPVTFGDPGDAGPDAPGDEQAATTGGDAATGALTEELHADPEQRAAEDGRTPGQLLEALEEAQGERDEYLDALQRSRAEFDNFRKRSAREAAGARQAGVGDLATRLLDVLDDLDRTVAAAETSHDDGLAAGIRAVQRKLNDVLVAAGVERVDQTDVPFDANKHEAVQQVPADEPVDEPEVAEVLRPGYVQGDRCLRAAMVAVRQ